MKFRRLLLVFSLCFTMTNNVRAEESCAYILPGYGSTTSKELYQQIGAGYQKTGITPTYIEIDWSTEDIHDYIAQAKSNMAVCDSEEKYFYGFSLGGLIALALASEEAEASVSVVVSSVAPFFKEDIEGLPWYSLHSLYNWWLFGNSESISERDVVSNINDSNTKVVLLVGSDERELMLKKSSGLAKALINGTLVIMEGVKHGISQPGHIGYIISKLKGQAPNKAIKE